MRKLRTIAVHDGVAADRETRGWKSPTRAAFDSNAAANKTTRHAEKPRRRAPIIVPALHVLLGDDAVASSGVEITSGSSGTQANSDATLTFSPSGGVVTLECGRDGGAYEPCCRVPQSEGNGHRQMKVRELMVPVALTIKHTHRRE